MAEELKILHVYDPGETTGFVEVLWNTRTTKMELTDVRHIDFAAAAIEVHYLTMNRCPDIIVYERFALYDHKKDSQVGSEFPSSQVIGMIKMAVALVSEGETTWHIELVKQPASVMSRCSVRDEHANQLVGRVHAISAYKHALYYITAQYALLAARGELGDGSKG